MSNEPEVEGLADGAAAPAPEAPEAAAETPGVSEPQPAPAALEAPDEPIHTGDLIAGVAAPAPTLAETIAVKIRNGLSNGPISQHMPAWESLNQRLDDIVADILKDL